MEIEAKFAVPNRQVYRELSRVRELAGYRIEPIGITRVSDRYYDTPDGRLLAAAYACRIRSADQKVIATLKGTAEAQGAIHRRDEREVLLQEVNPDPTIWPDSAARTLALELAAGLPLEMLFELTQERATGRLMAGDRYAAILSLDAVRAQVGQRPALYYELEVELTSTGTEDDLAIVADALSAAWHLMPETRSKFQRALARLRERGTAVEDRLSDAERCALEAIANGTEVDQAKRAAVILGWARGLQTKEICEHSGLSDGRVRFWLRAFRRERMSIFDEVEVSEAAPESRAVEPQAPAPEVQTSLVSATVSPVQHAPATTQTPAVEPAPVKRAAETARAAKGKSEIEVTLVDAEPAQPASGKKGAVPEVVAFAREHGVDMDHARFVASRARELFDALRPYHHLPRKRRRLLRLAAYLHTVGALEDPDHPYRAGRDLVLMQPLRGVSTPERLALATIVAFNRSKIRPERETTMTALDEKLRDHVLVLSALLHVAEALDASRTQTTEIRSVEDQNAESCEIHLGGAAADVDATHAAAQAMVWYNLFKQELLFIVERPQPIESAAVPATAENSTLVADDEGLPEVPRLDPSEPMSEAGRRVLFVHFSRMLANEQGTRLGTESEALHDMRVATRRMRAAFVLFAPYFESAAIRGFGKDLRRTGNALGVVRDLDVLLDKARSFQLGLPSDAAGSMELLLSHWCTLRDVARREMIEHLDGKGYRSFVSTFRDFLTTPEAGALHADKEHPGRDQVRHVVPSLIMMRYESARAYEAVLPGSALPVYHQLRIDCKRLRYTLEFFRETLGPEAPDLIKQLTALQDLLGNLQDARIAEGLIDGFLAGQRKKKPRPELPNLAGIQSYADAQRSTQQELLAQFSEPWEGFVGLEFRQKLGAAIAVL